MVFLKDTEVHLAEYQRRMNRINREAWQWEMPDPTGATRTRKFSIDLTAIRQHVGMAIVRAGTRLLPPRPGTEARS